MKLIYEFTPSQIDTIHQLYLREWWTKQRSLNETQDGINGSQICIGIIDDAGVLQGFCRVVTDFTFKALIFDVIVSTSHRKSGLGNLLMKAIIEHSKLSLGYRCPICATYQCPE